MGDGKEMGGWVRGGWGTIGEWIMGERGGGMDMKWMGTIGRWTMDNWGYGWKNGGLVVEGWLDGDGDDGRMDMEI